MMQNSITLEAPILQLIDIDIFQPEFDWRGMSLVQLQRSNVVREMGIGNRIRRGGKEKGRGDEMRGDGESEGVGGCVLVSEFACASTCAGTVPVLLRFCTCNQSLSQIPELYHHMLLVRRASSKATPNLIRSRGDKKSKTPNPEKASIRLQRPDTQSLLHRQRRWIRTTTTPTTACGSPADFPGFPQ